MYLLMMQRVLRTPQHEQSRPASVVVYLDRKLYREDPGRLEIEGEMNTSLRCTYRVVKLWTVDPEPILAKDAPGLWPFVPLMNGNPAELLVKSKERIVGAPESVATLESKKELLAVLGGLASRVIGDRGVLDHLIREITDMGENYVFDRLIEMGREQGAKEGARSTARKDLLRVLRRRFGEASESLSNRLDRVDDLETLEHLVEEAAVAPTLEAFLAFLRPSSR